MLKNKRIFGIKLWELFSILGVYIVLSLFYYATLWINSSAYYKERRNPFDPFRWFDDGGLQYILMFLATSVVWFLIFNICKNWKLIYRLLLHIIGLPFFVFIAQQGYYFISELLGQGHLTGSGQIWDVYIPTLIYLIQFSIFHAYEYYVVNQQKMRAEIELKNVALKSELSALKAQLNPHFLYNVFNTINASVPPEMENTREMIAELSDLFRYQLKASIEDLVPLEDELNFVEQYLNLEKKRFEDRLQFNFKVDSALLKKEIPPMILQPLVENSVKHGISPLIEGGSISIEITQKQNNLLFKVTDTGIGIKDKSNIFEKGVGLGNTQQRLKKMYQSEMSIQDNMPRGLIVSFTV